MSVPSVETAIWLALKGRVETLPISIVPQSSIAWPKVSFTPPQSGTPPRPMPYLEVRHLPNTNTRRAVGHTDAHRRAGILQVTLKYPTTLNHAEAVQTEIAGQIAAHFPAGLRMTYGDVSLQIEKAPDIASSFRDGTDPYWQTPLSIRYRLFK
jgi:hypothetical protein